MSDGTDEDLPKGKKMDEKRTHNKLELELCQAQVWLRVKVELKSRLSLDEV